MIDLHYCMTQLNKLFNPDHAGMHSNLCPSLDLKVIINACTNELTYCNFLVYIRFPQHCTVTNIEKKNNQLVEECIEKII